MATGAGVKGFGVERRSTGLAGGPVPANFGRASGTRGFCGEQSVRWVSWDTAACLQGPPCLPRMGCRVVAQRRAVMLWSSTALTRAGQAHLWGQGPWGGAQGMMLERHGLQGHLPGLGRGGGGEQAGPCTGHPP